MQTETRNEYKPFTCGNIDLSKEVMAERPPIKPEGKPQDLGDPDDSSTWSVL